MPFVYPDRLSHIMILSCLFTAESPGRGRGVYTSLRLDSGQLIEESPVIVMNSIERELLDRTLLHDYIFAWGEQEKDCCVALGYLSIYNHSYRSNAEYEMDFQNSIIRIRTVRNIYKGEEIFINYNGTWDDKKPVWFDLELK
jgi:SET domain-containing protein